MFENYVGCLISYSIVQENEVMHLSTLPTHVGISDVHCIYVLAYIKPIAVLLWVESHSLLHSLMCKMRLLPREEQERRKFKRCNVTYKRDNISPNSQIP
jgi:hypothetical protein